MWGVAHDLTTPLPLRDESVARIHTEDFLEHVTEPQIVAILAEAHRVLVPGGRMRIGVPDYNNPKDRFCIELGRDPRDPRHVTMTTYGLMKRLLDASAFREARFYQYWEGERFVHRAFDPSLGLVKRTPDHDPRSRRRGLRAKLRGLGDDVALLANEGLGAGLRMMSVRPGHRLHVTSVVVDAFK